MGIKKGCDPVVRVRFAPSPTGHLHIGGLRTAIFNWLYAKHCNGAYLLRIEDTDIQRSKKEYLKSQLDSLKWMNLLPDEEIVFQSSRQKEHLKVAYRLMQEGKAYPCFCEPKDATQKIMELESGVVSKYSGYCRDKKWTEEDLKKPHAIRLRIPEEVQFVKFVDLIRGEIVVEREQLDDFVIVRRDGTPTYNFVVVLDDIFMRVSHVIRGEDHISNTPKQILIYNILGENLPKYAHLPLILGQSGGKLSKRDAAVAVESYKREGFLADALFNYLVRLGWSYGDQEIFSRAELVEKFDVSDVGKKGAVFDIKKLRWLNGIYIRKLNYEEMLTAIEEMDSESKKRLEASWQPDKLEILLHEYGQRAETLSELVDDILSFAEVPDFLDVNLISKWVDENTDKILEDYINRLSDLPILNHESLLNLARVVCEKWGIKLVRLAQPLRLALTGKIFSPGVFELIALIGKKEATKRINLLIKKLKQERR